VDELLPGGVRSDEFGAAMTTSSSRDKGRNWLLAMDVIISNGVLNLVLVVEHDRVVTF